MRNIAIFTRSAIMLTCLSLSACGGDSESPPTQAQQPATTNAQSVGALPDTAGLTSTGTINESALPDVWTSVDVGTPDLAGSASYSDGQILLSGNGYSLDTNDSLHFIYQPLQGDGQIVAQLTNISDAGKWGYHGLMVRETLNNDSQYASNHYFEDEAISFFKGRRDGVGINVPIEDKQVHLPNVWLKLERVSDVFIASISNDGETWQETHRETVVMRENVLIGLAANAHHKRKITTGTWQNVEVSSTGNSADIVNSPTNLTAVARGMKAVALTWQDNADNETGYRVERAEDADSLEFESFAVLSPNSTYLVDHALEPETTYHYRVSALMGETASGYSNVVNRKTMADESKLPDAWSSTDIGSPAIAGFATYTDDQYSVSGNGYISGTFDSFHFVYQPLEGNGEIVGQLLSAENTGTVGYHGIMIRETLDTDSQFVSNMYHRSRAFFKSRSNGAIEEQSEETKNLLPLWFKLERLDDLFITYISDDGETWQETHRATVVMGDNVFIGLTANAHSLDKITKGTWQHVQVFADAERLAPPTNVTIEASINDEVTLTWQDNSNNETGFRIERAVRGNPLVFEVVAEVGANTTFYQDDGLTLGTHYVYRIVAVKGNVSSHFSEQTTVEVLAYENAILYMQRLAGDYDKTDRHNSISVTTTGDSANNLLRHPGMIGKEINVELERSLSASDGTISFKITPNTHQQTTEFFSSDALTISQVEEQLHISANGINNIYNVRLDTLTCNHVAIRFKNGVMSPYVNGEWFDDVNVGSLEIDSFNLQEYDGNVWDILLTNSQISDEVIYERSARCTEAVEPTHLPFADYPFRLCGVYTCLWLKSEEQLLEEKKRVYLHALDIAYDRNTFDVQMFKYDDVDRQASLDRWVNRENNSLSNSATRRFEIFTLDNLFSTDGSVNTHYWLHENFHGYQMPLFGGGKWLAEATASWASWNFNHKSSPGYGHGAFTLNPHLGMYEITKELGKKRYYHTSIMFAYITAFVTGDSIIGKLYNSPEIESDAFKALIKVVEDEGHDFPQVFAEFAARTTVWDYPDPKVSDDLQAVQKKAIVVGEADNTLAATWPAEGTYGIYHVAPKRYLPGAYGWNSYKIESTAAGTYTLKVKGSDQNTGDLNFIGKVVKGKPGAYEYVDLPIGTEVSLGNGEAEVEVTTQEGEELFLVVVAISEDHLSGENVDFVYEYAIESSAHPLPNDHIRTFVLPEQTGPAIVDHKNYTVTSEVQRGTDVSVLSPTVTLSDGAFSSIPNGTLVDFTHPVVYSVTGLSNAEAKDWVVTVEAMPLRTDTDFVTFEIENITPFFTVDKTEHTVSANLLSVADLTAVRPVFSLSDGATSVPASGEIVDLTNPVTYTVTAEDGTTIQSWTVLARDFRPYITTWQTDEANTDINLSSGDFDGNYEFTWKDAYGLPVQSGSVSSEKEEFFQTTLVEPGTYTLEIKGYYPYFHTPDIEYLKDVNQWGDIPWKSLTFGGWDGDGFSATDLPNLSNVTSMYQMFVRAKNFNSDISQWDTSNVTNMSRMFSRAAAFNSDISGWDVSNVTSMESMFREAFAFNRDIGQWDTTHLQVTSEMFFGARTFNQNLGSWNITSIVNMEKMFSSETFSQINYDKTLTGWAGQNARGYVVFGAEGLRYCEAETSRYLLINELNWTITGDELVCP
jgi:surface protein